MRYVMHLMWLIWIVLVYDWVYTIRMSGNSCRLTNSPIHPCIGVADRKRGEKYGNEHFYPSYHRSLSSYPSVPSSPCVVIGNDRLATKWVIFPPGHIARGMTIGSELPVSRWNEMVSSGRSCVCLWYYYLLMVLCVPVEDLNFGKTQKRQNNRLGRSCTKRMHAHGIE